MRSMRSHDATRFSTDLSKYVKNGHQKVHITPDLLDFAIFVKITRQNDKSDWIVEICQKWTSKSPYYPGPFGFCNLCQNDRSK